MHSLVKNIIVEMKSSQKKKAKKSFRGIKNVETDKGESE